MAKDQEVTYLRSLPGLKKLRSLRDVEESPVEDRLTKALLAKWTPLLSSLVSQYSIPGRLDPQDLKQELIQSIWKLTNRMDPVSRPTDFDRMCRTELRNKCVDLNRHAKARKRMGRTGYAAQCGVCGGVSKISMLGELKCAYCSETQAVRKVETYSKDVSLMDSSEEGNWSHQAVVDEDPTSQLILEEMISAVASQLSGTDLIVLKAMINPPADMLEMMMSHGYTGDHRQAPLSLLSKYHGIPERDVSARLKKIKAIVAKLVEGSVSGSAITRATSRQGR